MQILQIAATLLANLDPPFVARPLLCRPLAGNKSDLPNFFNTACQ